MPNVRIERFTPRFEQAVREVVREVYDEYGFTWEPEGYHADLFDIPGTYQREGEFWVAVDEENRVLGCVGLLVFPEIPGTPSTVVTHEGKTRVAAAQGELVRLYVRPDARRLGVGTALVHTVREEARSRGVSRLEMWSDKRLVEAHDLYQKLGATVVGERICHDPDQSPEWGLLMKIQ